MKLQHDMPTRVMAYPGAVADNGPALAALGTRCLIVTGHSSARLSGALGDVTAALDAAGVPWQLYDQIGQNPLLSQCHGGGAAARAFGADFLIGIGGGSPLDAVKAVAVYAANPQLEAEQVYGGWPHRALPFALVGTTSGTGSEVTPYAVLTSDATGKKKSISGRDLYGVLALGDGGRYTASLPRDFTVSTALDALSHSLESYFIKKADPLSRSFCLGALQLLLPQLRALVPPGALPDTQGREELYQASLLAGMAINRTGTGFCHPMGYVLTEEYGVPHGVACAVFLGEYLRWSKAQEPRLFDRLMTDLGTTGEELAGLIAALTPAPLPVLEDQKIQELLDHWTSANNMKQSPGTFDRDRQREVARRVLQGRKQP